MSHRWQPEVKIDALFLSVYVNDPSYKRNNKSFHLIDGSEAAPETRAEHYLLVANSDSRTSFPKLPIVESVLGKLLNNTLLDIMVIIFFQMLSHEAQVLKQGLTLLSEVLTSLEPLISRSEGSPLSSLLHEVVSSGRPQQAMTSMQLTPLLHGIVASHAYISMFLHVCKVGQVRAWFVMATVNLENIWV